MVKELRRSLDELGQNKSESSPNPSLLDNCDIFHKVLSKIMYLNSVT